jgi:hypothetical protein
MYVYNKQFITFKKKFMHDQDLSLAQLEIQMNLLSKEIESLTKEIESLKLIVEQMQIDVELALMVEIKSSPYRLQIAIMLLCKAEILAKMQKGCKYQTKAYKEVLEGLYYMFLASLATNKRYRKKQIAEAISHEEFRPHVIVAFSSFLEDSSNRWPAALVKSAFKVFISQIDYK